jgi:hypothetical protein
LHENCLKFQSQNLSQNTSQKPKTLVADDFFNQIRILCFYLRKNYRFGKTMTANIDENKVDQQIEYAIGLQ